MASSTFPSRVVFNIFQKVFKPFILFRFLNASRSSISADQEQQQQQQQHKFVQDQNGGGSEVHGSDPGLLQLEPPLSSSEYSFSLDDQENLNDLFDLL